MPMTDAAQRGNGGGGDHTNYTVQFLYSPPFIPFLYGSPFTSGGSIHTMRTLA